MSGFTNKQRAFIDEYLIDFNATQAAIRAGYSERTARAIGWENLTKPDIKTEIEQRVSERAMSADEVLIRLGEMARGDMTRYMLPDGELDIEALREDGMGHLLKKYKVRRRTEYRKDGSEVETESREAELYDAQSALVHIGKYHKLFVERTELTGAEGGPVQIATVNVDTDRL